MKYHFMERAVAGISGDESTIQMLRESYKGIAMGTGQVARCFILPASFLSMRQAAMSWAMTGVADNRCGRH